MIDGIDWKLGSSNKPIEVYPTIEDSFNDLVLGCELEEQEHLSLDSLLIDWKERRVDFYTEFAKPVYFEWLYFKVMATAHLLIEVRFIFNDRLLQVNWITPNELNGVNSVSIKTHIGSHLFNRIEIAIFSEKIEPKSFFMDHYFYIGSPILIDSIDQLDQVFIGVSNLLKNISLPYSKLVEYGRAGDKSIKVQKQTYWDLTKDWCIRIGKEEIFSVRSVEHHDNYLELHFGNGFSTNGIELAQSWNSDTEVEIFFPVYTGNHEEVQAIHPCFYISQSVPFEEEDWRRDSITLYQFAEFVSNPINSLTPPNTRTIFDNSDSENLKDQLKILGKGESIFLLKGSKRILKSTLQIQYVITNYSMKSIVEQILSEKLSDLKVSKLLFDWEIYFSEYQISVNTYSHSFTNLQTLVLTKKVLTTFNIGVRKL